MKIEVPAGKYVLGVSGGVDSVVLLDLLSNLPEAEIIVAHFNHGIRPDAAADEDFVRAAAVKYGLAFEAGLGKLGPAASENTARAARYEFLESAVKAHRADKIITAHHQDDWIETAFINVIRGSGRQGLSSIASNTGVIRPLLHNSKSEILKYAEANKLQWREDSTNSDEKHLRNYLRLKVLTKLTASQRNDLLARLDKIERLNTEINRQISLLSNDIIDRFEFSSLPVNIGNEILAEWLRRKGVAEFDAKTIYRLNMAIRTARPDTVHPVKSSAKMQLNKHSASLFIETV